MRLLIKRVVNIFKKLEPIISPGKGDSGSSRSKNRKEVLARRNFIRDASRSGGDHINYYSENGFRKVRIEV